MWGWAWIFSTTLLATALVTNESNKPNAYKVAVYAGVGVGICAVGRFAYDYAIKQFPQHEAILRVAGIVVFSVLIVYCSIRPIMNEAGDYWK